MTASRRLASWLGLLARDTKGALAVNFALIVLPLSVLTCGAVDMASVLNDRQAMQRVADATALDAASQLLLADTSGVPDRAKAYAASQLTKISDRVDMTYDAAISNDGKSVTIVIDGHRPSFFANLLPPGGFHLKVKATASSLGRTPLCVLNTGADAASAMGMGDSAHMTAPGCLVHSDGDIGVTGSALLQADAVQAVGAASGRILPQADTGAAAIPDPFAANPVTIPNNALLCLPLTLLWDLLPIYDLPSGPNNVHCGNIIIGKNSTARLAPGVHYFAKGKLQLKEGATLTGDDVVLIFDSKSYMQFQDDSQIALTGRKSGQYAGFVIATTNDNTGTFEISSDHASKLLGTIYMPNATLSVAGTNNKVADQSAWTVIVAKSIRMSGSPDLVINHNYPGSTIPVPEGVGPNRGVALTH
jgi:hypothetical protein